MRFFLLAALVGCSSTLEVESASLAITGPSRLVAIEAAPATVGDQLPLTRVGFIDAQGSVIELEERAVVFVESFIDGAALIDSERRLYQVWPFERRMLAAGVSAVASDGERLVYVVETPEGLSIRVHDGREERELSRGLVSAGVLKLERERVLFVGAANGGFAGVWQVGFDGGGARCVTNCDLRTGEPWRDRFIPPPMEPELLEAP